MRQALLRAVWDIDLAYTSEEYSAVEQLRVSAVVSLSVLQEGCPLQ